MGVRSLRSSIFISVLIHGLVGASWMVLFRHSKPVQKPSQTVWIELDPNKKNPVADEGSKRMVQTQPGNPVKEAPKSAHLGERNQTVERETVSRERLIRQARQARAQKPSSTEHSRRTHPSSNEQGGKNTPSKPLSKFGIAIVPTPSEAETRSASRGAADWMNIDASLAQDYMKGLKEAEVTALSTREYVFYGYFQRIRSRLDLAWEGKLRQHLTKYFRGGRQLASDMSHTTKVLVVLNELGQIIQVQVLEESGTRDLDRAAVDAFNTAGPFPNPPKGIVDAKGNIQLRWDFVLRS